MHFLICGMHNVGGMWSVVKKKKGSTACTFITTPPSFEYFLPKNDNQGGMIIIMQSLM